MGMYARPSRWLSVIAAFVLVAFMGISCANTMPTTVGRTATVADIADVAVYVDALASNWENWSWDTTLDLASANPVHAGSAAIAATYTAGFAGVSLRTASPIAASEVNSLAFWIYGNGAPLSVYLQSADEGGEGTAHNFTPAVGVWAEVVIPLTDLGSPSQIARINWQNNSENAQAVYYLDDIRLLGDAAPPPPNAAITLQVDAAAARKAISPYIYGVNDYGTQDDPAALIEELQLPVRRWGGNLTSRYNWQNDISNHASDWFFNNNKQSNAADLPADSAVNRFITVNRQGGADSFVVLPLIGYVSNGNALACAFSVTKYGPQQSTAAADGRPDCGNGVRTNGTLITGNDPLDTSIAINTTFVVNWINALKARFGSAGTGSPSSSGVRFYNYDNEPDLWFETHRDVQPTGYTYDIIRDLTYQYGAIIKATDPGAQLLGPAVHGWPYYWHSPYDGQREDWADPDDRNAHGGTPFIAWYLQQMAAYETNNNLRILDYLDVHYYPQAAGVALGPAGSAAVQALRLRSTRSLWDATYVDESWIPDAGPEGGIVQLIPRMRAWIDANYPGTKLAIGEYNWGGLEHINGALAQADVLGIFGREGVDLATMWQPPQLTQPGAFAFRIYRNYDGANAKFGDTSVAATSSNQEQLSVYASQRSSDNALTIVIVNKSGVDQSAPLTLQNFSAGSTARLYRYSAANLNAIMDGGDTPIANGLTLTYPADSITLLVIPPDTTQEPPPPPPPPPQTPDTVLHLPFAVR